jgi:hypothetical protein
MSHPFGPTSSAVLATGGKIQQLFSEGVRLSYTMTNDPSSARMNPTALTLADAAHLLARVGFPAITEDMLRADVAAGAPTNADGTINLVHYAAWLVKEMGRNAGERDGN